MLPLSHLFFGEPVHGLAVLLPAYCPSLIWESIEQILGSIKSVCICYSEEAWYKMADLAGWGLLLKEGEHPVNQWSFWAELDKSFPKKGNSTQSSPEM